MINISIFPHVIYTEKLNGCSLINHSGCSWRPMVEKSLAQDKQIVFGLVFICSCLEDNEDQNTADVPEEMKQHAESLNNTCKDHPVHCMNFWLSLSWSLDSVTKQTLALLLAGQLDIRGHTCCILFKRVFYTAVYLVLCCTLYWITCCIYFICLAVYAKVCNNKQEPEGKKLLIDIHKTTASVWYV